MEFNFQVGDVEKIYCGVCILLVLQLGVYASQSNEHNMDCSLFSLNNWTLEWEGILMIWHLSSGCAEDGYNP